MEKRFVLNGDGTVTDTKTGLMWQQETAGPMPWEAAMSYCKGLSLGGHTDWRPPRKEELELLGDFNRFSLEIDVWQDNLAFPNTMSANYWTCNSHALYTWFAWCVFAGKGTISHENKLSHQYVRAVRG